jgi:hypothetical protein
MTSVDITTINPDELLEELWKRSKPAGFFLGTNIPPPQFSLTEAKLQLVSGHADYICGRAIKANVYGGDSADPRLYDREMGEGAFQKVVDDLLKKT